MTDASPLPDLPADLVDELLVALLDGELSAAASDAGLDPDAIRARLETSETARSRLAELVAARDALADPEEPLDDLARRRILDAVLQDESPTTPTATPWHRRRLLLGAAAAVAAVLVVGAIAATWSSSGGRGDRATSTATSRPLDLGSITDASALRAALEARFGRSSTSPRASSSTAAGLPSLREPASESARGAATASPTTTTPASTTGVAPRTLAGCVATLGGSGPPRLEATATFAGRPVYVVAFDESGRTLVYVLARSDCAIVTSQSF